MNTLLTAKTWLDMGIAVIPIGYRSKRPNTRFLNNGEWKAYQDKLPCMGELEVWFANDYTNIGVVTGWQNLVIVDFDYIKMHNLWRAIYSSRGMTHTYTVATGRGYHYYYFVEDFPAYTLKWAGGEIKASGYCLVPPSIHPSGKHYQAVNDKPIMKIDGINDIFPAGIFDNPAPTHTRPIDPFLLPSSTCAEINQHVPITDFFDHLIKSGNGWYKVHCPFPHANGSDRRPSGWIDTSRNRYGCHACVNGSMSVIDFYMRLHNCDLETAMRELCNA